MMNHEATSPTVAEKFQQALNFHQQKQWAQAQACYEDILSLSLHDTARQAEVWHLLGVLASQQKNYARALLCINTALSYDTQQAIFYYNRALAFARLNRYTEAVTDFIQATTLQPTFAIAHFNQGVTLMKIADTLQQQMSETNSDSRDDLTRQERIQEAIACYDQAIAHQADYAMAYANRGVALAYLQKFSDALASYNQALALDAEYITVYNNRALALLALGQIDAALESCNQAISLNPNYAEAYFNRGLILEAQNNLTTALGSFQTAIQINPSYVKAYYRTAVNLHILGQAEAALLAYQRVLDLQPNHIEARANCGLVLADLQQPDEALTYLNQAIAVQPSTASYQWNKAIILLAQGHYKEGWHLYEQRWQEGCPCHVSYRNFNQPLWLGKAPLQGKTILLCAEQGLGDTIQFCRYIPLVIQQGARVVVEAPQSLIRLLQHSMPSVAVWVATGNALPHFDCYCPLLSLPLAFQTFTEQAIPAQTPYLFPSPSINSAWQNRLAQDKNFKIGLVWRSGGRDGNWSTVIQHEKRRRDIALPQLLSLHSLPAQFYSLQVDEFALEELQALSAACAWQIADYHADLRDFAETAGLINQLDLVLGVDTAATHLAGALGKPTWIFRNTDAAFRWLNNRADSPWYPNTRLFQQSQRGEWQDVITRVEQALRATLSSATPTLT